LQLEEAVHAGAIDSRFLGLFAAKPQQALQQAPEDVAVRYGIPKDISEPKRRRRRFSP